MKDLMYMTLAFFLSGQAIVAYLLAVLLAILLGVVIVALFVATDPELLKMILFYEWPQLSTYFP